MKMTYETGVLKSEILCRQVADLQLFLQASVQQGTAPHQVELGIWSHLLHMGRTCLEQFLAQQGSGDMGETITLPSGATCQRLEELCVDFRRVLPAAQRLREPRRPEDRL